MKLLILMGIAALPALILILYHFWYHEVFLQRGKLNKQFVPSGDGFLNPAQVVSVQHGAVARSDGGQSQYYYAEMSDGRRIKLEAWEHAYLVFGWKETPPSWERKNRLSNWWGGFCRKKRKVFRVVSGGEA